MLLMLSVWPEREADLLTEHRIQLSNEIPSRDYRDLFGNICTRLVAPAGLLEIRNEFVISEMDFPMKSHRVPSNGRSTVCPTMCSFIF